MRVVAYALRLLPKHRNFCTANSLIEDPSELEIAEKRLQLLAQSESFEAECKALGADELIKGKSRIAGLSPFVGPSGLLRSQSRLRRLGIADYDAKHPVILDSKHPLVKLMLQCYHKRFHHMGPDYIRAQVNCKYIALGARSVLRSIAQRCVVCRKRDSSVISPLMADLPKERLGYMQPPFANCGVDYFGPFFVTVRRSTEKRWAFLFTCLTTRAIHLEVVPSLDTSSCVAVLWKDAFTRQNYAISRRFLLFQATAKPEETSRVFDGETG